MSTTTLPPDEEIVVQVEHKKKPKKGKKHHKSRAKRLRKKTARAFRRMGHKIKHGTKKAGRKTKSGAKKTAHVAGRALKKTGIFLAKGVGYIGLGAAGVVRLALGLVSALVIGVVSLVMGLLGLVGFALSWTVTKIYSLWTFYVYFGVKWLVQRPNVSFKTYRNIHRMKGQEKVEKRTAKIQDKIMDRVIDHFDTEGTTDTGETTWSVTPPAEVVEPFPALKDKVQLQQQTDQEIDELTQFPGAHADLSLDRENLYDQAFFDFNGPLSEALGKTAKEKRPDFDFAPYINDVELRVILEMLADDAPTMQERAYWVGRMEMLDLYNQDPRIVESHGKAWAVIHHKYRNRQAHYPLAYLRTGMMDMVKDVERMKDSIALTPTK